MLSFFINLSPSPPLVKPWGETGQKKGQSRGFNHSLHLYIGESMCFISMVDNSDETDDAGLVNVMDTQPT